MSCQCSFVCCPQFPIVQAIGSAHPPSTGTNAGRTAPDQHSHSTQPAQTIARRAMPTIPTHHNRLGDGDRGVLASAPSDPTGSAASARVLQVVLNAFSEVMRFRQEQHPYQALAHSHPITQVAP